MKATFAHTKNLKAFLDGVNTLMEPVGGRLGLGIFYGPPGTGKTEIGKWYAANKGCPYIRAGYISTGHSLLSDICDELGESPSGKTSATLATIVRALSTQPRPVIIDECDYLVKEGVIELLRDISDEANSPVIMIGMEKFDGRVRRYSHLYDRVRVSVKMELFSLEMTHEFVTAMCEYKLSDEAISLINKNSHGKLRLICLWIARAEMMARANKAQEVTAAMLGQTWGAGK